MLFKLLTLPEHLSSPLVFSGVRVTRSSVLCVMFGRSCLPFGHFFLSAFVLSILRFTDYNYPIGIFKLFLTYSDLFNLVFLTYSIVLLVRIQIRPWLWLWLFNVKILRFYLTYYCPYNKAMSIKIQIVII